MAIKINFATFGSVFVVPVALVDNYIKLATESQLKVLLYVFRHSDKELDCDSIAKDILVHPQEVKNAVDFWCERGLMLTDNAPVVTPVAQKEETPLAEIKHPTAVSRLQRPDISYVANRLTVDKELCDLMNDIEFTLKKVLSASDKASVVMMKETLGLPCEVIYLLVNYCSENGKNNMRAIEKMAVNWSDKGIFNYENAERMIERLMVSNNAWHRISRLFGVRNIGLPTDAQLNYADTWCNEWKFSDDMLLEAYERCVNSKGEYNIRYINGILKKWYNDKIFNLSDLQKADMAGKKSAVTKNETNSNSTFDIATFESKSLFND